MINAYTNPYLPGRVMPAQILFRVGYAFANVNIISRKEHVKHDTQIRC